MGIPLVALAGRQPQIQSPTDVANAAVNLSRNRTAEQSEQLDVQQKQQALQDQRTIMQTLAANKGDIEASLPQLAGKITPQAYTGLAKWNLDQRKTHAEIDDKELTVKKDRLDRLTALHQQAMQIPDEQYPQQWPMIAAAANQIDPKLNLNPQQPLPKDQLQSHGIGLMVEDQYLKQEQDKRAAAKSEQELQENKTKMTAVELSLAGQALGAAKSQEDWDKGRALLKQRITGNAFAQIPEQYSPQAVEQVKQQGISPEKAAAVPVDRLEMADWLKKNPGKGPADYMKYKATLVPQFNINMGLTGGGAGPSSGAGGGQPTVENVPSNLQGSVKAVLEYRSPMPPQSRANPVNTAIRQWVNKIDPTYDETTFPQRNKILTEYVKDANTGQIGAINTALGHLGELNAAAKALDQNDLPLLHSLASKVGAAFGADAATTYTGILHRVGPELTSAYLKGGGTVNERGSNEGDFSISKGQKQIVSNIGEAAKLLRSKMASKEQDWNVTFKPAKDADKFENRFITPEAKQTLDALSSQSPVGKESAQKVLTSAQIQKAAKDHGVSVEEATKQAKAAGYTVQ